MGGKESADPISALQDRDFGPDDAQTLTRQPASAGQAYLPGTETYRDHEGGVSTARPIHCTPSGLTRTTTPNRGGSSAQFLLVGTSVRAVPFIETK